MFKALLLFSLLSFTTTISGQKPSAEFCAMFYNVENLFDVSNDSLTNDEEFTPAGSRHWSYKRYLKKLNAISRVIKVANGFNPPTVVGLCEVENERVLKALLYETGLKHMGYGYIHYDSPDKRGIDVALLYRSQAFIPLESFPIRVSDSTLHFYTRDALYIKGLLNQYDTLHIVVNHWPSKRGGEMQSEKRRIKVAAAIKAKTDSILNHHPGAQLLVMGDLNAELHSPSVQLLLSSLHLHSCIDPKDLRYRQIQGSHKYQGHWSLIDHILISSCFREKNYQLEYRICDLPFLLEDDTTHSGLKPYRTYAGPRYIGGGSDHLPVILTIKNKE